MRRAQLPLKFMTIPVLVVALAAIACTQVHAAQHITNAAPFGLEIGVATCDAAKAKLKLRSKSPVSGGISKMEAADPEGLFHGATNVRAICDKNKVVSIQIVAYKGDMSHAIYNETFAALSSKYKLISTGPIPDEVGRLWFAAGNTYIELDATELSYDFKITYSDRIFYESVLAKKANEKQMPSKKIQSPL